MENFKKHTRNVKNEDEQDIIEAFFNFGDDGVVVAIQKDAFTEAVVVTTLTDCSEAGMDDREAFDMLTKALDKSGDKYEKKVVPGLGKMTANIGAMNQHIQEKYPELFEKTNCFIGLGNEGDDKYSVYWHCGNIGGFRFDTAEKALEDLECVLNTPHVLPLLMLDNEDDVTYRYSTTGVFALYERAQYCEDPVIEGLQDFFNKITGRRLLQIVCDEEEMLSRNITKEQKDAVEEVVSAIEYIARTVNGQPVAPEYIDEDIDDVPLSGCMPS